MKCSWMKKVSDHRTLQKQANASKALAKTESYSTMDPSIYGLGWAMHVGKKFLKWTLMSLSSLRYPCLPRRLNRTMFSKL